MRARFVWAWWRLLAFLLARYEFIDVDGPYLSRWHFPRWLARVYGARYLFLHYFHDSDDDRRGWHYHPWTWCESRLLTGAYVQSTPYFWRGEWCEACQVFVAGQRNRLTDEYHLVQLLRRPVWTLFRAGPKHGRSWGFMNSRGEKRAANPGGMQ